MSVNRIVFIVTQECQLRCKYCYLINKNGFNDMTLVMARRIVDFVLNLQTLEDSVIFDFIGGEPLLRIDLIEEICDYVVSEMKHLNHKWLRNYSFRLTTNGILYSSTAVQRFVLKYYDKLQIQISIDGSKQKHDLNRIFADGQGSYDYIVPSVRLWISQFRERATAMMVYSHPDLPFLSQSVIHLIELGIKKIAVTPVVEDSWLKGDDLVLEEELIKLANYVIDRKLWDDIELSCFNQEIGTPIKNEHIYPCGIPMLVFDSNGNIYSCVRFVQYSLRDKPARVIGNINSCLDYNKIRPFLSFDVDSCSAGECLNCEYASCCRWCPAENYDSSEIGTIFRRTTTVCEIHKANTRAKNYFWNKVDFFETHGGQ